MNLDELAYRISPLFAFTGAEHIANKVQDSRLFDAKNALEKANTLEDFRAVAEPTDIYNQSHLEALKKFKQEQLGRVYKQEAAPIEQALSQFSASGLDADPDRTGVDVTRGNLAIPGINAMMSGNEYDAMKSGVIPANKKGADPLSAFAANPITADLIQKAEQAAQEKGTLARIARDGQFASPLDLATIAMNKDRAGSLDNVIQGLERFSNIDKRSFDQGNTIADRGADATLAKFVAEFPLEQNTESWNKFVNGMYSIPNVDVKKVDELVKSTATRNKSVVGEPIKLYANSGNATASGNVAVDMFGNPIPETKVTVASHPSQSGGGSGGADLEYQVTLAETGPDGTPIMSVKDIRIPADAAAVRTAMLNIKGNVKGKQAYMIPSYGSKADKLLKISKATALTDPKKGATSFSDLRTGNTTAPTTQEQPTPQQIQAFKAQGYTRESAKAAWDKGVRP